MVNCGCILESLPHSDSKYNQIKEELSMAYLTPICAFLGFELQRSNRLLDNTGIDCTITAPSGKFDIKGIKIDLQMKGTSTPVLDKNGENLLFCIDCRLYEMMRSEGFTQLLLFVHILPEEINKWVVVGEKELTVSEMMLWYSAVGSTQQIELNQKKIQVKIPITNVVNNESLYRLFKKISEGEVITNED